MNPEPGDNETAEKPVIPPVPQLNPGQLKYLRGLAMALKPRITIGKDGLTEGCLKEVNQALDKDELIKVRIEGDRTRRNEVARETVLRTHAVIPGIVGKNASLYRPQPNETLRRIKLPGL